MTDTALAQAPAEPAALDPSAPPPASTLVADAVVETPTPDTTAPAVPEVYDLKMPDTSTLDATFVERTAAIARSLGLSNESAQRLLDERMTDATAAATAQDTLRASWQPGGDAWNARDTGWRKAALADVDIGGSPDQLAQSVEKAQQALAKYGGDGLKQLLIETGFGSHPAAIKFLASIGHAMSEGSVVLGVTGTPPKPRSAAEILYGEDGTGPKRVVPV